MRIHTVLLAATAAVGLSACVVVPVPGTSPATSSQPTSSQFPTLRDRLAGQAFVSLRTGSRLNFWSDGTYTVSAPNNQQAFGSWRANEGSVELCFTGNVAPYTNTGCIPIRYDGDFLTFFDATRTRELEVWQAD